MNQKILIISIKISFLNYNSSSFNQKILIYLFSINPTRHSSQIYVFQDQHDKKFKFNYLN